jgi:hypothetical protein
MDGDYPAAHSMDTHWFAVDPCGHVAVFDSGEDGAVPKGAPDVFESLAADLPFQGELDRCLQERMIVPGVHAATIEEITAPNSFERPIDGCRSAHSIARGFYLLGPRLKSDAVHVRKAELQDPKAGWIGDLVLGTTDGRDWVQGDLGVESYAWLHEMPHRCLGCVRGLHLDFDRRAEVFRIIRYDCSSYGLHPYERVLNPIVPATVEEIEKITGRPLPAAPRFAGFCFRHKRLVQPIQWLPCRTWGSRDEWVDEDGRQRTSEKPAP